MMTSVSKIRFFLYTIVFAIILTSCNKKNDVIPDVYVDFTLDLNYFVNLSAMGNSDTVDSHDARITYGRDYAGGYNGNGIIIHARVEEFYAYDRTCPHDYAVNGLGIKVIISTESSLFAVCPRCGTKYALSAGGTPASGIGRYPLKNYKTSFDGTYVRVWN
jgi:nitrite reductase/ring-hydroxylating ferredoxin subunit